MEDLAPVVAPDTTPGPPLAPDNAPPPAGDVSLADPSDFHTVIGTDGQFLDGWKESLPEELRHEESLNAFTDVPGAIKQLVHAQKAMGKNKITLPGENATDDEKNAFQMALGRPETKDGYALNIPEGFEDVFDAEATKESAFEFGFNQQQLDKVLAFRAAEHQAEQQAQVEADKLEYDEAEKIIAYHAGEAMDEQMQRANRLIQANVPDKISMPDGTVITGEEYKEKLLSALNDNAVRPYAFNFLANLERKLFSEHSGTPDGANQMPGAMTPQMLEAKADELTLTEGYLDGKMLENNPAGYKRLTMEIADIYNRLEKAQKGAQS